MQCACFSGKTYDTCCGPYHEGKPAENALLLMRSRYSAYALGLADYILRTTHPLHADANKSELQRRQEIERFSKETTFCGLDIVSFEDGKTVAYVTFRAHLRQNNQDVSFSERSAFEKINNEWKYREGTID